MLIDAGTLDPDTTLRAEVCVVGGGPLAIAVVRELEAAGIDVVQLESGGIEDPAGAAELEDLAAIQFGGVKGLNNTRQFGGNANAWQVRNGLTNRGVRMVPMTEADFDTPRGPDDSRWPFPFATLRPELERAQRFLGLPEPADYSGEHWATPPQHASLIAHPSIRTNVFQFADGAALVRRSLEQTRASTRVRLVYRATTLEVLTDDKGRIATGVRAAGPDGRPLRVEAQRVVLAAGAASTTRILLESDAARPDGLGNGSGLLGRYFMDHLLIRGGELQPVRRADLDAREFYDLRVVDGTPVMGHVQLSDAALRDAGVLNLSFVALPRGAVARRELSARQQAGTKGALAVREALIRRRRPSGAALASFARGADGALLTQLQSLRRPEATLGRGGWSLLPGRPSQRYTHFTVMHQAEQAPHADNRITLSQERDRLGARKLVVDWRWHDEDVTATMRAQDLFRSALAEAGWGDFRIARPEGRPLVHSHSSNHFMGTTRMDPSPKRGVVDADGAVHGTAALYVASSSVFPSGGFANVTLTALAVAFRTADAVVRSIATARSTPVV